MNMTLAKIPMPFGSMRDPSFFELPALLPQEAYKNDLKNEALKDSGYSEIKEILDVLNIRSMREYHDVYLFTDVLAFADCFETFRHKFMESSGLDPFHYLGLPGAAWKALLRNSDANFENITEECCNNQGALLMKHVDDNIRGGLSCAFTSYAKANNPRCPWFDSSEPITWIKDFDANSLYPYCMAMPMPVGGFRIIGGSEHGQTREQALATAKGILEAYTPDFPLGAMLVVKLEIPEGLHDKWDYAPAVNRSVAYSELSERQKKMKRRKFLQGFTKLETRVRVLERLMKAPGYKKLVPDLSPQDHKAIHVEHAQELVKHGAVITELYACFEFEQERVFKEEIERLANERANTSDEALREIIKLTLNAPFGKTLENRKMQKNFRVHTDKKTFQRCASFKRTPEARFQHFNPEDGSFLGTTTSYKRTQAVLDTPRMMGWAILEYAKMVMLRFHYGVMKPMFGDALQLLYTDTDSLYYQIRCDTDPIDHIAQKEEELKLGVFDLSQTSRYNDSPLKNKLGCFKYEGANNKQGLPGKDDEIIEAVFATSKSYMKRMALGEKLKIRQKGVPESVVKKAFHNIELYKDAVFSTRSQNVEYNQMRSLDHRVAHLTTKKVALSAENEKVFQVSPYESRPHGHWRNKEPVPKCEEWDLSESEDEAHAVTQGKSQLEMREAGESDDDAVSVVSFGELLHAPSDADSEGED